MSNDDLRPWKRQERCALPPWSVVNGRFLVYLTGDGRIETIANFGADYENEANLAALSWEMVFALNSIRAAFARLDDRSDSLVMHFGEAIGKCDAVFEKLPLSVRARAVKS